MSYPSHVSLDHADLFLRRVDHEPVRGQPRAALGGVLPALRTRLLAAVPGGEVTPARLERIRPRTLLTLVASVAAVYLLAGELQRTSLSSVLRAADWRWGLAALALSAATYAGATEHSSGSSPGD